jgi:hypothetical protein
MYSSDGQPQAGTGPVVVSNDQLRDHKAGMAMPTAFSDWAETHIARYEFEHAVSSDRYVLYSHLMPWRRLLI